jgi:hypothetical protein
MTDRRIDVQCPKCKLRFKVPLGEALMPVIEGEIEHRLEEQRKEIIRETREAAAKDSDERNHTAIAMRDKVIADMRLQIDDLRRKVDLGSQQMQGEVQQLALEAMLRNAFPGDRIVPVPKGVSGADTIHQVIGSDGTPTGTILWESKNTKTWTREWLSKIKQDMRAVNATLCVIATATLPKGVEFFDRIDTVFVVSLRCALPLAQILRQVLIDIAVIRATVTAGDGVSEKLLSYITGQQFYGRVSAVLDGCISIQGDLNADKRATARRWARTQHHIDAVVQNMGAMFGDLQGLLGSALRKVPGLALEGDADAGQRAS